ncbi:putative virion structural protein [Erwinia phage phiEaH2]|uniref:Putative virion structural protein n=1 Tax=Erwinia phage phiEaH2 TaxID=1029988 RepID=J7KHE3_9CAUD|nr:putative virion structural protein [Erwinia phage phiEaH2]AFQ96618.1 putative virion structural protein [Erwinia phage phiEaH2]
MALKLLWKNPNTVATTIDIYRGDTSNVSLTTPLKTVDGAETSWIDTTALFGKTYYYVWAVNSAVDRVVSRPQKIEVSDRRGPGSNLLRHGDENYGYYGAVSAADFVNSTTLYNAAKNTSGLPTTVIYPTWHKFARKGKVVFVPNQWFGDVTWQSLYDAGLVYGTDDVGGANPAGTVNQLTTFDFNGETFLIRLMKGMPEGLVWDGSNFNPNTFAPMKDVYAEYEDFLYPLCKDAPLRQRMVSVDTLDGRAWIPGAAYNNRVNYGVICQEALANVLVRGTPNYNNDPSTRSSMESTIARSRTAGTPWVPVVEYVGRVGETFTLPKTAK